MNQNMARIPEENGNASQQKQNSETTQSPTWEERLKLVRTLQARALQRQDPFVANLEVISGDLMMIMYRAWEKMEAKLLGGAASESLFAREVEAYRKLAREVTRSAQAARLLAQPDKGGAGEV